MYRVREPSRSIHRAAGEWFALGASWGACLLAASVYAAGTLAPSEPLVRPPDAMTPLRAEADNPGELQRPPLSTSTLQRMEVDDLQTTQELEALRRIAGTRPSKTPGKSASTALDPGQAAWTLGLIYLHGAGLPQDRAQARIWFERANQLGNRQALAGLTWCAIDGCDNVPNPAEADRWITPYKRVDRGRALYLEWLALDRLAPLRTATPDLLVNGGPGELRNRSLLVSAARSGDIHALIELGLEAVAQQEPKQALRYFETAASKSHIAASNAAIVAESIQAKNPKQRSDGSKLAEELYTEAQRFHRGEGRAINYVEAIRLYRIAADKGSVEAQRMLALIYSRPLIKGSFDVQWISQLSELDLTRSTPGIRTKTVTRQLQRERTPLVDLLPEKWRARIF